jgi:hypothetical protein
MHHLGRPGCVIAWEAEGDAIGSVVYPWYKTSGQGRTSALNEPVYSFRVLSSVKRFPRLRPERALRPIFPAITPRSLLGPFTPCSPWEHASLGTTAGREQR